MDRLKKAVESAIEEMAYSCLHGHIVFSHEDLSWMLCPVCLGRVRDKTAMDERILSKKTSRR